MKILLMTPTLLTGGVQTFLCDLAVELSKNEKNEVFVLCFSDEMDPKYDYIKNERIKLIFLHKKLGFSVLFLFKLYKTIRKIDPDIINTHSSRTLRYILLLPLNRRYKFVHTITNNPRIYNPKLYPLYKRRMHQKSWRITFVGISDLVSDTLSEVYSYDRNKIATIYNGIRLVGEDKTVEKKYVLFNCAALSDIKRHWLMIDALSKVDVTDTNLAIAGDGPNREKIETQIKELSLEDKVDLLGNVSDPSKYYRESRFFILTSASEGNPLCIAEAMSAGLPIIAPRVGGIPDLVEDGVNGFLFDVNSDSENVAVYIKKCLELSDSEIRTIAQRNIEKSKQWDYKVITKQYQKLYDKVAGEIK